MVIALAFIFGNYASDDGGVPKFSLAIRVTASDGTYSETNAALQVTGIAATSTTADINAAIVDACTTWVNGQHSWALDPKNLYFQPFCNGS